MKRSSPLRRLTSLQRRSTMRRHPTARKRSKPVPAEVRDLVAARDRGCVGARLVPSIKCWGPLDPHHILRRSQGGTNDADNLVTLCRAHHDWVHAHPVTANELGLLRRSWS